ncbi:hypothetical protein IW140_005988 [Coemansia sp. RSA 1813]|nr:hypothetical protein EV178_006002 [Coemansia sp. RSA 1646]KAJ1767265.1 hypothetical protein LPJ74_005474 [Coemansia sp. RSA 1843]KAJ2086034.1 hypothetical protein IW138_005960 [Coemansia sp. RSA 986]KAJ2210823.1 hypothetical protein EV179_005976 [Coemansia sp. RSA 487]KAJ2563749.1 hypothetical protein IW140_005988 [Coemansia sp. RSA 1813]
MTVTDQPTDQGYNINNTYDDPSAATMSLAISHALQALQQEQQSGLGFPAENKDTSEAFGYSGEDAGIESANEYGNNDELSMTQEFTMSSPRRTENHTLSQVDFDQWMQVHAALEGNSDIDNISYVYDSSDQYSNGDEDEDEEREQDPSDVHRAWLRATQDWSSDEHQSMDVDNENIISITSSDEDEDEEGEFNTRDDAQAHVGQADLSGGGSEPLISGPALLLADLAEQAAAVSTSVTLESVNYENTDISAVPTAKENDQYLKNQILLPTQPLPPLDEMSKTINESLDRSNELANDIYAICSEVAATALNTDYIGIINERRQDENGNTHGNGSSSLIHGEYLLKSTNIETEIERIRAEASAQQDKLNAQLVKLNTELFQLDTERNGLCKHASFLEKANHEYKQNVDQLEKDVAELKRRLSAKDEELQTTIITLSAVERERKDFASKCASLGSQIERVENKLQNTSEKPLNVQESRASEQNRDRADKVFSELREQLLRAQNRERLLLGTNRALEARLGDALRKLADPVEPIDILADHRRHWDAQLVEARSEAKVAKESLARAEQQLESEKAGNECMRIRVMELESMASVTNVTPRKRKADCHSDAETIASVNTAELMSQETAMTIGELNTHNNSRIECQQAVVSAGEFAQSRRRKLQRYTGTENVSDANIVTPTPPRTNKNANRRLSSGRTPYKSYTNKPVTPRIHLNRVPADSRSASKKVFDTRLDTGNDAYDMKENMFSRRGNRTLEYRML